MKDWNKKIKDKQSEIELLKSKRNEIRGRGGIGDDLRIDNLNFRIDKLQSEIELLKSFISYLVEVQ